MASDKFIGMFFGGHPITAKEVDTLMALRMESDRKLQGVFDVNFDKCEFAAVGRDHYMNLQGGSSRAAAARSHHMTWSITLA